MELHQWLETDLQQDIWKKKYQYKGETLDEFFDRVSGGNQYIKNLIIQKKFLPAGRILSNRKLYKYGRKITYSNCYVITPPEDSIESIFECATKLARTYSYGGGCGTDISELAPRGTRINNAAKQTTGAVSFMDLYSLVTELIGQQGRRGALMISLSCNHPDIEEFINIKNDINKITKANISIKVTDDFMEAVENNEDYTLKFIRQETGEIIIKTIKARQLFRIIAESNWNVGDPGFMMWDRIRTWNLVYGNNEFEFASTNPCGELPLPAGGSCLLSSFNLSKYVLNPFIDKAYFDYENFEKDVYQAVVFMNEVLDEGLPLHPLEEQRESVSNWRQIGIGIMGLADMFIKMGIKYGSPESISLSDEIGSLMIDAAIYQSALLAKEYGAYPKYNKDAVLKNEFFITNTSDRTKKVVEKYGLRNSQLLSIAPTGSISTMLNISGGIEPLYSISYTRKTESLHGEDKYYKVYSGIVKEFMDITGITNEENLQDYFVTAMDLNYKERIDVQATWQKYIDNSISSTVNVPESFTVKEIEDLYMYAWKRKVKGITIYRDNCKKTGILTVDKKDKKEQKFVELPRGFIEEAEDLTYRKYKLKTGCGNLYFFVGVDEADNRIYDCFTNTDGTGGCTVNTQANSRLLSAALRGGVPIEYLAEQLEKAGTCPSFQYKRGKGEKLSIGRSCASAIAYVIKQILKEFEQNEKEEREEEPKNNIKNPCPNCGKELRFESGCSSCVCGWSRCG